MVTWGKFVSRTCTYSLLSVSRRLAKSVAGMLAARLLVGLGHVHEHRIIRCSRTPSLLTRSEALLDEKHWALLQT